MDGQRVQTLQNKGPCEVQKRRGTMLATNNKAWTSWAEKIFNRFCFKVKH